MFPPAPLAIISKLRLSALSSLTSSLRVRVQGWDPLYIISQIVLLQSLHYLTLSFFLPTLLYLFASPLPLEYAGGSSSISMIMDWREFLGASISSRSSFNNGGGRVLETLIGLGDPDSGSGTVIIGTREMMDGMVRLSQADPSRGWIIAFGWILSSLTDVLYLYHIVRRPTHILDSSLTLLFNHLILTTYYSSHFPTSFFFWFIVGISTTAQIILAEQWCVRREMRDGFKVDMSTESMVSNNNLRTTEDVELGKLGGGNGNGRQYERVSNMEVH